MTFITASRRGFTSAVVLTAACLMGAVPAHAKTRASTKKPKAAPTIATGVYGGTITDPNGEPDTYTASIRITAKTFKAKRSAGSVTYSSATNDTTFAPALSCRGTLTYLGRSKSRFSFRETIAGGAGAQCTSGGTVTLTLVNSRTLTYAWTMHGFTDPTPTGRLARKG